MLASIASLYFDSERDRIGELFFNDPAGTNGVLVSMELMRATIRPVNDRADADERLVRVTRFNYLRSKGKAMADQKGT